MSQSLQLLFSGITVGATYALAALGSTLIYNASNEINFAQGEMAMLCTYVAWQLTSWGLPLWLSGFATLGVAFAFGAVLELVFVDGYRGKLMTHDYPFFVSDQVCQFVRKVGVF